MSNNVDLLEQQFMRNRLILRNKFWKERAESFGLKDKMDFYCSEHVIERMIERGLTKDVNFVIGICKWFILNVFYQTTYRDRSYQVSIKNLKCCFKIIQKIDGNREAILTTVYDSTEDYDVDEVIRLKF